MFHYIFLFYVTLYFILCIIGAYHRRTNGLCCIIWSQCYTNCMNRICAMYAAYTRCGIIVKSCTCLTFYIISFHSRNRYVQEVFQLFKKIVKINFDAISISYYWRLISCRVLGCMLRLPLHNFQHRHLHLFHTQLMVSFG